jgi:pyruvate dehydrogenase E1 component alpha subunit
VDGNDVEKVAEAFEQAVNKARSGGGPSLIEASCYRFRGHFEGDADTYRSQQEKQERRQIDPLTITRALVLERNLATASQLEAMEASVRSAVLEMLAQVRAEPHPNGEHALRHVFVEAGS